MAVQIANALSVIMEPFVPFASRDLGDIFNLPDDLHWEDAFITVPAYQKIKEAKPLFHKIEALEEEMQNMLEKIRSNVETVSIGEFSRMDLRIGRIVKAETIPGSRKLLKLTIDIGGNHLRQAVAGIAEYYAPRELEGKHIAVMVNLDPRRIFGVNSEVMILAAQDKNTVTLIQPDRSVETGSKIS